MEGKILPIKRVCVACDATKTYHWRLYDGNRFCDPCYQKYVRDTREKERKYRLKHGKEKDKRDYLKRGKKRINYKGKVIHVKIALTCITLLNTMMKIH
jgi:hypothetical protein